MSRIIGIDLGTTNTCTAYVSNMIPRVIPIESGFNTMPSVVSLTADGRVLVGQAAKEHGLLQPERTIVGVKRLLGRQFGSPVVQDLARRTSYAIVADERGEAAVEVGTTRHSTAEIQSHILRQVKRYAEINLGEAIPEVVIAVPAYYSDHQRALVKQAGQQAGWTVRRIINEPTAAALAYGFNRGFDQKILIYDLGGGTFDVSVLELTGNVFQVIATGGDMFLGGADFDARVQAWIVEQFRKQTKIDLAEEPAALQRIREAAERAKIELSLLVNTEIRLPALLERRGKPVDLTLVLDRETLNALTRDLVERTIAVVDQVLADAALGKQEIEEVIPVGGQTRMPLVVDAITQHFGKAPRKGVHPDECVALGAALLGDSLAKIDAVTLLDTLSVPIGRADPAGNLAVLIGKNVSLPFKAATEVRTEHDGQTSVQLDVFQGEAGVPVREAEYLGTLVYDALAPGPAGSAGLAVELLLDGEGMLNITATDLASGEKRAMALATLERPAAATPVIEKHRPAGVTPPDKSSFSGLVKSLLTKK